MRAALPFCGRQRPPSAKSALTTHYGATCSLGLAIPISVNKFRHFGPIPEHPVPVVSTLWSFKVQFRRFQNFYRFHFQSASATVFCLQLNRFGLGRSVSVLSSKATRVIEGPAPGGRPLHATGHSGTAQILGLAGFISALAPQVRRSTAE